MPSAGFVGEQKNRLLRIEKADNLIFNGSARRKSLPYAEVSLEVEDFSSEMPRLVFTKRVHRGGDTEYLINNQPARPKRLSQLLLGNGALPS
jgi:chromosome segregation protein